MVCWAFSYICDVIKTVFCMKRMKFIMSMFGFASLSCLLTIGCKPKMSTQKVDKDSVTVLNMRLDKVAQDFLDSRAPSAKDSALVQQTNNRMAFQLFKQLFNKTSKKSVFLSPQGLTYALSIINDGAVGDTRKAFERVLGFDNSLQMRVLQHEMMLSQAYRGHGKQEPKWSFAEVANTIDVPDGLVLSPAFKENATKYYFASMRSVEKQNITLTSEVRFHGFWKYPFDAADTEPDAPFFDGEQKIAEVQMMHNTLRQLLYYDAGDFRILQIPYTAGYHMYVLLPKEGVVLAKVVRQLDTKSWGLLQKNMHKMAQVELALPRMALETSYTLNDYLVSMGLGIAFGVAADFSKMTEGQVPLYIKEVKQKSKLIVAEKKTEAQSVTTAEIAVLSATVENPRPDQVKFYCDHPFAYVITDKYGSVNFVGTFWGK